MKYVLIIPDGAADEPQAELQGQTPIAAATTPNMDLIARTGIVGQANHVPLAMSPGSDVGTMTLFGYDTLKYHTGRAPIEAAAQHIELGPHDWAVRCNLVTVQNNHMVSFTANQIASDTGSQLMEAMQQSLPAGSSWNFQAGVSYRNLLIYRGDNSAAPFGATTKTTPPHDILDEDINAWLPQGEGGETLRKLMAQSAQLFAELSTLTDNKLSKHEATQVWLWGQGSAPKLEPFTERFGVQGAVITAVDLLRGMGQLLGWEILEVPTATGYTDTDYHAKGLAAINALQNYDLVVVHVEASDEASHEGDVAAKVTALEKIDSEIVGPIHSYLQQQGEYRMLISPDHPTFLRTRTHSHGYVPFTMAGRGISPDNQAEYNESTAAASGLTFEAGHLLMPKFIRNDSET